MKRMLFNATQPEEIRVAIVDGQKLIDIDIETTGREQRKSNIYKGVITRIEPSLEACFVNYGEERHGFLPFKEVARSYFKEGVDVRNTSIKEALREGQEIIVQVEKEERGNKGAALTSFISLAGRYLVLMPNNPRGGGVSRRVEGEDRQELRDAMDQLELPSGMSVIARTAGIGRSVEELQWDLNYLLQLWTAIEGASKSHTGAFLIYQESSLVIRAIRDYFQPDIGEILIDTDEITEQAQQFMTNVMPDMVHRVKRYRDEVPLFSRFQIEHQIETAYARMVNLPSGGSIVIDHTEALVSIDVNSARATRGNDIEATAFNTNIEAADEVARQLRLRDLGGLVVIDFIDMEATKNQRDIETRLKEALRYDRARVQMGKISRFGLMELSRQRLRPSLSDTSHITCPRCNGTGHIRDTESSALQILRIIQEEAMKENSAAIHVQTPVDVAAFLLNEKRAEIQKIEALHHVAVVMIPNKYLETPHYDLERIKEDDPRLDEPQVSYAMAEKPEAEEDYTKHKKEEVKPRQEAVVKSFAHTQPAPIVEKKKGLGLFAKIARFFAGEPAAPVQPAKNKKGNNNNSRRDQQDRNKNRNNRNNRNNNRDENAAKSSNDNNTETKQQRTPRQPREPREKDNRNNDRTDRESRSAQQQQQRENRRNEQREQKEEQRKERVNKEVQAQQQAEIKEVQVVEQVPFNAAEATDETVEPRRRRRRGGRNRNRRDRDANDTQQLALTEEITEVNAENAIEVKVTTPVTNQEAFASIPVETTEPIQVHIKAPEPVVQQEVVVAPVVEKAVKPVAEKVVENELAFAEVSSTPAYTIPSEAKVTYVDAASTAEKTVSTTETVAEQVVEKNIATESVINEVTEPVQVAKTATRSAKPAAKAEDLDAVLAAAGLTLASTNPEKLRKAQEEAQNVVTPVHIPRERKPVVAQSNEPLVQIETRNQ